MGIFTKSKVIEENPDKIHLDEISAEHSKVERVCFACTMAYGGRTHSDCAHCEVKINLHTFTTKKMAEITGTYEF